MRYIDGKGPPPVELELGWMCERWDTLPEKGALMDQNYMQLTRMAFAHNVHRVVSRTRTLVGRQIHGLTMGERQIIKIVRDMGLL